MSLPLSFGCRIISVPFQFKPSFTFKFKPGPGYIVKLFPTNVTVTNQLVGEIESVRLARTHQGVRVRVTFSLQFPISVIHIKVPVAIFPLVEIQLAHPTKTCFDPEKIVWKSPHDVCSTFTIAQAVAVVVIRRASYESGWAGELPGAQRLCDVEVGDGGRGESCSDEECE